MKPHPECDDLPTRASYYGYSPQPGYQPFIPVGYIPQMPGQQQPTAPPAPKFPLGAVASLVLSAFIAGGSIGATAIAQSPAAKASRQDQAEAQKYRSVLTNLCGDRL